MLAKMPDFAVAIPEMFVLAMIRVVMLLDLFFGERKRWIAYTFTQLTLVVALILILLQFNHPQVITFNGMYILDKVAVVSKIFILLTSIFVFIYSRNYVPNLKLPRGEYHLLGLFAILGMMVLVSSYDFLSLYLGLELLSLPLYAMVALNRDSSIATEAAMKFFIMGALASGMLLYGISMLYGACHSLEFPQVAASIAKTSHDHSLVLIFGMVFIVVGVAFKLGAAPFHMWVPDVYDGAPSSVTLFITTAPKIAGFIMAIRLLVDAMPHLYVEWQHLLIAIAVLSITLGNVIAIAQTNIKRMLAYSSIAHMGYMLLGLIAVTNNGYAASFFYIIVYAIMSLGGFGMIVLMSKAGFEAENIEDFRGLNSRNSWLAFLMLLLMFSMAGIPPTVGFFAKLGVLEALINAHQIWLAAFALLMAVIGAFYYLRVVKVMYFDDPIEDSAIKPSLDMSVALTINSLAVLVLGIFPSGLINLSRLVF